MKLVKDGIVITETRQNNISAWLRAGYVEVKEDKKVEKELEDMDRITELYPIAKEKGIKGYAQMKTEEIIKAIQEIK